MKYVAPGIRTGIPRVVWTWAALLFAAVPAAASPCFDLWISRGGVGQLAVGETLALRAYRPVPTCLPPPYAGKARAPHPAADMPLRWSVTPAEVATISEDGVLTAKKAGRAVVSVACRDETDPRCEMVEPGRTWIDVLETLPGGRLPRLEGKPRLDGFTLVWDEKPGVLGR